MQDPRFYEALGPVAAETLAAGLVVRGAKDAAVSGVAAFGEGGVGHLSYLDSRRKGPFPAPPVGVVVAAPDVAEALLEAGAPAVIESPAPRADFSRMAARLFRLRTFQDEGPAPVVEAGARVAATAVVCAGVAIGAGAEISPYAVIGPGCMIGRHTVVGPHVSLQCALVGDHVHIGAGSVIGERGFGVAGDAAGLVDVPHLGRVILQDRVSIGACCTVDRGMIHDTVIGEESKIDNLSQIAHNVRLGRGVIIAAFGGISGSTVIGDGARLGGRVGVSDHRQIGAGAALAAGSGVTHDVPAGEAWGGYPAQPMRRWMRETAWLRRAVRKGDGGQ